MTAQAALRKAPVNMVPRVLLIACGALVLFTLGMVSVARIAGLEPDAVPVPAAVVAERSIVISGTPMGGTEVRDVDGTVIAKLGPQEAGFINGVFRALSRERRKHGVAEDAPVTIRAYANGRLALSDALSGWNIELIGFGKTNSESFEKLLKH